MTTLGDFGATIPQTEAGSPIRLNDPVRVRESGRPPFYGQVGWVADINPGHPSGEYLVRFSGGIHQRYHRQQLITQTLHPDSTL